MGATDPKKLKRPRKPKNSQGRPSGRQEIALEGSKDEPESTELRQSSAGAQTDERSPGRATDEQMGGASDVVSRDSASEAGAVLRSSTAAGPAPAHVAAERAALKTPLADAGIIAGITRRAGVLGHGLAVASLLRQAESALFSPRVTAERVGERQRQLQQMIVSASTTISRQRELEQMLAPSAVTGAMQRQLEHMIVPASATAAMQRLEHIVPSLSATAALRRQCEQMMPPSRLIATVQKHLEQLTGPSIAGGALQSRAADVVRAASGIATGSGSVGAAARAMRIVEEGSGASAARVADLGSRNDYFGSLARLSQNEARSYLDTLTAQHRIGVGVLAGIKELQTFAASASEFARERGDLHLQLGITLSTAGALRKRAWHAMHGVEPAVPFDTLSSIRGAVLSGGGDSTWMGLARSAAATVGATAGLNATGLASQIRELARRGSLPSEVAQIAAGMSLEQAASIDAVERALARVPAAEWGYLSEASLSSAFAEVLEGGDNDVDTESVFTADLQDPPSSTLTSKELREFASVATDALAVGERVAADNQTRALFVELRSRLERLESSSNLSNLSLSIGVAGLVVGLIPLLPALTPAAGTFVLLAIVMLMKQYDDRRRG